MFNWIQKFISFSIFRKRFIIENEKISYMNFNKSFFYKNNFFSLRKEITLGLKKYYPIFQTHHDLNKKKINNNKQFNDIYFVNEKNEAKKIIFNHIIFYPSPANLTYF